MSARRVLIVHPQPEERARLRAILGEHENDYVEAGSRRDAGPLLTPSPSLVVSHHADFKKLIADLERKAPGAIRVVLSPTGDAEVLEELESIAAGGFDFLTVESDETWKLKNLVRRRASPRHPTSLPVDAMVTTRGGAFEARCVDVSNEGVGLLVPGSANLAALMPGEALMLTSLRRGDAVLMQQVSCSVQTVRRVEGSNTHLVGAVFDTRRRVPHAPTRITSALRVGALLKLAGRSGSVFSVSDDDGTVSQHFAEARLEGGRLHLLEPDVTVRHRWEPGQAVTISFELNGRQLRGYAGVLSPSASKLVVALPQALLQVHRRTSLRMPTVSIKASITVVSPLSGHAVTRPVLDLSSIGASFQVDPAVDVFPPGLQLDDVLLEVDGRRIQLSAVVASMGRAGTEEDCERRCGLQFTGIRDGGRQVLLDLLVRHLVAGAECGSQVPFQRIWDFFKDEGAVWRDHSTPGELAPERTHGLLGDGTHGLGKTFVIVHDGELDGHTSGLRIYSRTWLSQHLLVRSGFHRSAALSQQLMCLSFDYGEALPDIEYVRGLWRVSNRWAERIYGAMSMRVLRPGLTYLSRFEPMRLSLETVPQPGPLRVREATPDDERAFLSSVSATEDPVKLLSDDLVEGELHLESLSRRFAGIGLRRGRSLVVVEDRHGAPLGWALLESMSDGLFWAEMYSSFRIFLVDPAGPLANDARVSLASHAARFYAAQGRREAECHGSPADVAALEPLGFVGLGLVSEFGAHRSVVREITSQMIAVFARIRRHAKEEHPHVGHVEPERPTA